MRALPLIPPGPSTLLRRGLLARAVVLTAACASLSAVAPAGALASLAVQQDTSVAREAAPSDGDGVIGPGDSLALTEGLVSAEQQTLTNVHATLTSVDGSATITQGSATYPNLTFGQPQTNATPYTLAVPAGADCGAALPLNLALSTDQGTQDIPVTVQSGAAAPFQSVESAQAPLTIPTLGTAVSTLHVDQAGRVKGVRVRINQLTHDYVGDLRIELTGPDGTNVVLMNADLSNSGRNLTNTIFDSAASVSISDPSARAPYTGTFRPVGDLRTFIGHQQQGSWQLKITSVYPSDQGQVLQSWGLDVSPAICQGKPIAAIAASPAVASPGVPVTLDGSGSVSPIPGSHIVTWHWDRGAGGGAVDTSTPTVSATFPNRGQYPVTLSVTDNLGNTSFVTTLPLSVSVAPTAALSVTTPTPQAAAPITLDASASTHDPAGSIVDYRWDLDGSGSYATDTGTTPTVTTSYPTSRTVPVHVRVTDDTGATATAARSLVVANQPPTAALNAPGAVGVGRSVLLDASASRDADGSITDYRWDLDGSGRYATDTGSAPTLTTSFATPGVVNVGVRVTDNEGASTSTTRALQITRAPVASLTAQPAAPGAGQAVTLEAGGSSSPDGVIAAYRWDLDGSGRFAIGSGSTPFLVHGFSAGTYRVGVQVTDNYGSTATATITLVVAPGPSGTGPAGPSGLKGGAAGDPQAGIASLTRAEIQAILPGSDRYFAAITGDPVRRARAVAARGLWLNVLADRAAAFRLTISISAGDARRLKLVRARRGPRAAAPALMPIGAAATSLAAAGQRPLNVALTRRVRRALMRTRSAVKLLVTGTARDAAGHEAKLARVFVLGR